MKIHTIGHSTHSEEEFITLLKAYDIQLLVDIRSYPGSRYVPQFNKENMERWIPETGIQYLHLKELGGRRKGDKNINVNFIEGWKQLAFRNYAGYSLSQEYRKAIDELMELASRDRVCIMCSESVPWRCHRLIISNTLVHQSVEVIHIMSQTKAIVHELGIYGAKPQPMASFLIYPKEKDFDY